MKAIITGSARGMGKVIAKELLDAGADVAICDINEEMLKKTETELKNKELGKVLAGVVDVSKENEVKSFVELVENEFSKIDILINNAAIHPLHYFENITEEEWDNVLNVNLKGYFFFVKYIAKSMKKQKFGRIINISSEGAKQGGTIAGLHYIASKGGVLAFTYRLAKNLGKYGITVNSICPGRINTDMAHAVSDDRNQIFIDRSAVKRLGKPEDVAFAVRFLASKRASFITGETLDVNGGTVMD